MSDSISEEPTNRLPSNLGGSAHQSQWEPIHQLPSNLGGSAHQSDQFFPRSEIELDVCYTVFGWFNRLLWKAITQLAPSSNQGGSAHQPQLSETQFLANELWRALVPQDFYQGQIVPQDGNPTQPDILGRGVQPNADPGPRESYHETEIDPGQSHLATQPEGQFENYSRRAFLDKIAARDIDDDHILDHHDHIMCAGTNSQTRSSRGIYQEPSHPAPQTKDELKNWTAKRLNHYLPLYLAAQSGDWRAALCFIGDDWDVLTTKITVLTGKTVLHVAACCWQWEFVLNLLEHVTSPESIAEKTLSEKTVLHYVARGGSLKTAKALIQINSDLPQIKDNDDCLPLFHSISSGNKKLVWYLSSKTTVKSSRDPSFPKILRYLIVSGYHDIVLYFIQKYPDLALAKDDKGSSLLYWLARNPSSFLSGSNLGFLERRIYKFVHVDIRNSQSHYFNTEDISESILKGITTLEPRSFATQVLRWLKGLFWKTIAQLVVYVEKVRDAKLEHEYAVELVNHVCPQLSSMSFQEMENFLLKPKDIMASAVKGGIEEIVRVLFQQFPDLIDVQLTPERNILQTAIQFRQEKIVNIIKEKFPETTKSMSAKLMKSENTTLHLAGELAPKIKLLSVPGAALQMQRELQWFKEVKEIEFPILWEKKNTNEKTAKDVFREEHKDLAKEGEKWMKATANSCMVVSTLIATVLFAAAFTVPGGNMNDKGIPIFLRTNAFTIFAISDALGLFFSLTSLLMFLAILTARYEIDDFLESLPNNLIIGLGSLFFAIASMIIAFGAALTIMLSERWNWVFVPVTLPASILMAIFVMPQLRLFVQMVQSTCGASMFHPWPSRKFE